MKTLKKLSLKKEVIASLNSKNMENLKGGGVGKSVANPGYCNASVNTNFTKIMTCCDTWSICNTNCNCYK